MLSSGHLIPRTSSYLSSILTGQRTGFYAFSSPRPRFSPTPILNRSRICGPVNAAATLHHERHSHQASAGKSDALSLERPYILHTLGYSPLRPQLRLLLKWITLRITDKPATWGAGKIEGLSASAGVDLSKAQPYLRRGADGSLVMSCEGRTFLWNQPKEELWEMVHATNSVEEITKAIMMADNGPGWEVFDDVIELWKTAGIEVRRVELN